MKKILTLISLGLMIMLVSGCPGGGSGSSTTPSTGGSGASGSSGGSSGGSSDQLTISGSVLDVTDGTTFVPIGGVSVTLRDTNNTSLAATTSAADGSFTLTGVPASTDVYVKVSKSGYASYNTEILNLISSVSERYLFIEPILHWNAYTSFSSSAWFYMDVDDSSDNSVAGVTASASPAVNVISYNNGSDSFSSGGATVSSNNAPLILGMNTHAGIYTITLTDGTITKTVKLPLVLGEVAYTDVKPWTNSASPSDGTLKVTNALGYDISGLYIAPYGTTSFGSNLLSSAIGAGTTRTLSVPVGLYSAKYVFPDNSDYLGSVALDIRSNATFSVTLYNNSTSTGGDAGKTTGFTKTMLSGNTVQFNGSSGPITLIFYSDGSLSASSAGSWMGSGTWTVNSDGTLSVTISGNSYKVQLITTNNTSLTVTILSGSTTITAGGQLISGSDSLATATNGFSAAMFSGKSITYHLSTGGEATLTFNANGAVSYSSPLGTDSGTWTINADGTMSTHFSWVTARTYTLVQNYGTFLIVNDASAPSHNYSLTYPVSTPGFTSQMLVGNTLSYQSSSGVVAFQFNADNTAVMSGAASGTVTWVINDDGTLTIESSTWWDRLIPVKNNGTSLLVNFVRDDGAIWTNVTFTYVTGSAPGTDSGTLQIWSLPTLTVTPLPYIPITPLHTPGIH